MVEPLSPPRSPQRQSHAALGLPPVADAGNVGTCRLQTSGGPHLSFTQGVKGSRDAKGAGEEIHDSTWIISLNERNDPSVATPSKR